MVLPDLENPSAATMEKKALPAERCTFSDAKGLGSAMLPDLTGLKFVKGELPRKGEPVVILFWAKYAKGDYRTMVHFSYLMRALPSLQCVGVSCDAEEADCKPRRRRKDNTGESGANRRPTRGGTLAERQGSRHTGGEQTRRSPTLTPFSVI